MCWCYVYRTLYHGSLKYRLMILPLGIVPKKFTVCEEFYSHASYSINSIQPTYVTMQSRFAQYSQYIKPWYSTVWSRNSISRCLFVYLCVWYSGNFTVHIYSHNSYIFYSLFTQPNHFVSNSNSFQCCHTWQFVVHVYLQWCKDLTFLSDLIGTILFSLIQFLFVISWQRQHWVILQV